MKIDRNKVIESLHLRSFGAKGWLSSKQLSCPICGKRDKIGIYLDDKGGGLFNCFKCNSKGSIFKLLIQSGLKDLISQDEQIQVYLQEKLENFLSVNKIDTEEIGCEEVPKPLGFRSIEYDEYLEQRGWTSEQYSQFNAGTSIDPRFRNKIVFLLKEDGKIIGYLSRSKFSKEWHKENLRLAKQGKAKLVLRYDNSRDTKFERVVGGIDEVLENITSTVILVEGIMDKANTDKVLELNNQDEVKCCFTFGCKLSKVQALKLLKKGVKRIYLMYDPETIQQTKSAALLLSKYFEVEIAEIDCNKDPGEMNFDDFARVLSKTQTPNEYFLNKLTPTLLK